MARKVWERYARGGTKLAIAGVGSAFVWDILVQGADLTGEVFGQVFEDALDGSATKPVDVSVITYDPATQMTDTFHYSQEPRQTLEQHAVVKFGLAALVASLSYVAAESGRSDITVARRWQKQAKPKTIAAI